LLYFAIHHEGYTSVDVSESHTRGRNATSKEQIPVLPRELNTLGVIYFVKQVFSASKSLVYGQKTQRVLTVGKEN